MIEKNSEEVFWWFNRRRICRVEILKENNKDWSNVNVNNE